jgi:hypothetical protein
MGSAERVDVFISYTGRDWGWASWLDFILREAGYTTKVQGYDFMGPEFCQCDGRGPQAEPSGGLPTVAGLP